MLKVDTFFFLNKKKIFDKAVNILFPFTISYIFIIYLFTLLQLSDTQPLSSLLHYIAKIKIKTSPPQKKYNSSFY